MSRMVADLCSSQYSSNSLSHILANSSSFSLSQSLETSPGTSNFALSSAGQAVFQRFESILSECLPNAVDWQYICIYIDWTLHSSSACDIIKWHLNLHNIMSTGRMKSLTSVVKGCGDALVSSVSQGSSMTPPRKDSLGFLFAARPSGFCQASKPPTGRQSSDDGGQRESAQWQPQIMTR